MKPYPGMGYVISIANRGLISIWSIRRGICFETYITYFSFGIWSFIQVILTIQSVSMVGERLGIDDLARCIAHNNPVNNKTSTLTLTGHNLLLFNSVTLTHFFHQVRYRLPEFLDNRHITLVALRFFCAQHKL